MNFNDLSVLVVGFDGYLDVWNHCFCLMNKYWPNRPKTYLATSVLKPTYDKVITIPTGKDTEWSLRTSRALKKIDTKYVLLLLEDFFITDFVNNNLLSDVLKQIKDNDVLFYQLSTMTPLPQTIKGKHFQNRSDILIKNPNYYILNCQAAIWNKDYLFKIIGEENYNAWIFEVNNFCLKTNANINETQYLLDIRNILNITHAVLQSSYIPRAYRNLKSIGYKIDLKERKRLSFSKYIQFRMKQYIGTLFPNKIIDILRNIGKYFGLDFVADRFKKLKTKS